MKRALVVDGANGQVWRGKRRLELPPQAFAVLRYLTEHADRVVSKEELFTAVWPGTVVSEWALTTCLRRIRRALGEAAQRPQYIETVYRRGYRWIGPLTTTPQPVQSSKFKVQSSQSAIVGREAELGQLHGWLAKARNGERQLVFVTGEAGIGKTTLVDAFLERLETRDWRLAPTPQASSLKPQASSLWIGRGQCIEHYGAGEAYLPALEALGRLCRGPEQERLVSLLRQYAPTWLVQLPWLLSPADREALQREVLGATRERMLREMAEMIEALTDGGRVSDPPLLILVLEDLHWSDYATLDLLSSLARRQEAARLLILATYRPVEVIAREHPLRGVKQELQQHGQCAELPLEGLTEADVGNYLAARFASSPSPADARESRGEGLLPGLAPVLYQHTNGNPLFMINTVEDLMARGVIIQREDHWTLYGKLEDIELGLPPNIRQMIEQHIERLSPQEQGVLEVAGVAGVEFSAAAVASAGTEIGPVEECCARLARREHFVQACGSGQWPDGTVATHYRFRHALYQQVLYQRVTATRRQQLHRQIGERVEAAYGERAAEMAAALAVHFEEGGDSRRAVHYRQQAAETALRRSAHQEAIDHLTQGLALLQALPDTPERAQRELTLQATLAVPLIMSRGYAAPELEIVYARARELCQRVEDIPQRFRVLLGLLRFYVVHGPLPTAREIGEQLLTLARQGQDPTLLLTAHYAMGGVFFHLGELASARLHLEQCLALYDPQQHGSLTVQNGDDPGVVGRNFTQYVLWLLGYPDLALQKNAEALTLAENLGYPYNLVGALFGAATLHQFRRDAQALQKSAEAAIALSTKHGIGHWVRMVTTLRGWALAEQGQSAEGIAHIRQGLAAHRAAGEYRRPYHLALLAEVYGKAGHIEEGLSVVAEALALVEKNGERFYEAELYRLKGQLTLQSSVQRTR